MGIQLNGRVLAWCVQGPGFEPALKKKRSLALRTVLVTLRTVPEGRGEAPFRQLWLGPV